MTESDDEYEHCSIVIDNGSQMIKSGFGGDDSPRTISPTIIAKDSKPNSTCLPRVCDEVYSMNRYYYSYRISHPIQKGLVENMNDMQYIWKHIFYNELRIDPTNHSILLTDKPLNSLNTKNNREIIMQLMFEEYNFQKFHIINDAVLSLYASGRTTGVILDSGYDSTNIVSISQGSYVFNSVRNLNIGGIDITNHLQNTLTERGYIFTTTSEKEIVNNIKEKFCYVALDYENELEETRWSCGAIEMNYELPDGQVITIGDSERLRGPEPLFQPGILGCDKTGICEMILQSIMNCKYEIRKELLCNIVMSGGCTMFNSMNERLKKELISLEENGYFIDMDLLSNGYVRGLTNENNICYKDITGVIDKNIDKIDYGLGWEVKVIAPSERKYLTWIGGSILVSLATFEEMWIMKEEYDECGMSILYKKCVDFD
eukprot:354326_1